MPKYTKTTSIVSEQEIIVRDNEDGTITYIPSDPANSDYQAYLKSLDETSTL
jgi:hypothetical protein